MQNQYLLTAFFALAGYVLSSVTFSLILPLWIKKIDVRLHGSGNAGATNVYRTCGMTLALPCFLLDGLKGFAIVFAAKLAGIADIAHLALIAAFCILGHVYSVFLKFKGGKGVATSLFVILALDPIGALCFALAWLSIFAISRISSLSALGGFLSLFIYASTRLFINNFTHHCLVLFVFYTLLSGFIFYTHRSNIKKLLQSKESGFKSKK